jgi:23S rRNA (cytosine1962-C5)-methyltransferase
MFASDQYELLDFGAGRKLERFGPYVLDRPSPAAAGLKRRSPHLWTGAAARYERESETGRWLGGSRIDGPWQLKFGPLTLELKLTDSGQVGVFPEQATNWQWIAERVRQAGRIKVLNLFAYTGASTLAAAAAGGEVVHVDGSTAAVAWARRNARASRLDHLPVRWIVEDVLRFVRRERTRGNSYDAVILDPPAYGHGPRGQSWKLEEDLAELLSLCWEICHGSERFLLLTCHSGQLGQADELLRYTLAGQPRYGSEGRMTRGELLLDAATGQRLHCGAGVRWSRSEA